MTKKVQLCVYLEDKSLRNSAFWIFPVDVFGSSLKTTSFGTLKFAKFSLQKFRTSSFVMKTPSFVSIKAKGVSPHFSSGFAITAQASTPSILKIQFSISIEEIFSQPEIIISLALSFSCIYPSAYITPKSPVLNQPS